MENDSAQVKFFPPGIPLIAIVVGVIFQIFLPLRWMPEISSGVRYALGGVICTGSILLLGARSVFLFRHGAQTRIHGNLPLTWCWKAPYRYTRNPMYLQMVLVCFGVAIALANGWILLFTPIVAWLLQRWAIVPEEEYLLGKFGPAYLDYQSRVRRWI